MLENMVEEERGLDLCKVFRLLPGPHVCFGNPQIRRKLISAGYVCLKHYICFDITYILLDNSNVSIIFIYIVKLFQVLKVSGSNPCMRRRVGLILKATILNRLDDSQGLS
jgi:hypothetical protein